MVATGPSSGTPPSGTVTFLSPISKGSTRLWEHDATAMRSALERHNSILGEAIQSHNGYHYKTIGDAFQAAFIDPADAVAACVDAQACPLRRIVA
jgi:class 3 adenylate cyclase